MADLHQSGGHLREGHEETDLSIRGILWFGVFLVIGGVFAFGSMWLFQKKVLEPYLVSHEPQMTPMEQQLLTQREAPKEAKAAEAAQVEGIPEVYGQGRDRKQMEAHLRQTFPTPRLQYNDEHDMQVFRKAEDEWLSQTGKDANGNIHIPVSDAMDLVVREGLPAVSGPWQPPTLPTAVPMVPAQTAKK